MNNLFKICMIIFIAILTVYGTSALYSEEGELKTFRGTVQEIDWAGSLLTVAGMDEMTFFVPKGTKIIWGTETVGLSDMEQEDNVEVKYYDDPTGTPRAARITLNKAYPEF